MAKPSDARHYHHGDLRNAIKQAALDVISKEGPDGFSLREASRRVGVSPAAAYRHFPSKEALLAELAKEASDKLAEAMRRRLELVATVGGRPDGPADESAGDASGQSAGQSGGRSAGSPSDQGLARHPARASSPDALAKLRALGEGYVAFALENRQLFRLLFGSRHGCEQLAPEVRPQEPLCGDDPYGMLLSALAELRDQGRLTEPDVVKASLAAWSAVHGLATLLVDGVTRLDDAGMSVEDAVLVVLRGVTHGLVRFPCPAPSADIQHPDFRS